MTVPFEWPEAPEAEFAVLGDPVAHSLSPKMFSAAFEALGLDDRYVAIRVPLDEFEPAVDRLSELGYRGVNATIPLKEAAFRWSSAPDEFSQLVRAANTLRLEDRAAINTDAPGMMDVLEAEAIPNGPVLILGAGGSARAAAAALHRSGREVRLWNRTQPRAEALASETGLPIQIQNEPSAAGCAAVLNTTSTGLTGEALAVEWNDVAPGAVAFDFAYGHGPTPFLADAGRVGLRTIDGRQLLVAQGARSFEWWLGREAPRSAMLQAVA